ncbi:MAG: sulfotransferase family 2 domain-containing protein [Proteobacteria bacterium]|nr:sulfotransferase family 2 domain-containing protein [Pseudomonadota bacterium]
MSLDARELIPAQWRVRLADLRGRGIYAGYPNHNQCIFIHIPKTAGTGIAQSLFGAASRHIPYTEYQRANPAKFKSYFKFAFVRNPWDRLVSTYFYLQAGGMNDRDHEWAQKTVQKFETFEDFVLHWVTPENIRSWVHFLPQSHYVLNERDDIMMDFLGRFERLSEDFSKVAARLGKNVTLPVVNPSGHDSYADYYTPITREIVRKVYARDITAFGYRFDG